ncbi:hypothetical protein K7432_013134 [Basidiobolus ranarum]|uniref:Alcohol dehydrogenase n=1 Tax=Basidiobolus ranarum TaxID=34480 RepID=A0ABR2WJP2_9FUNG
MSMLDHLRHNPDHKATAATTSGEGNVLTMKAVEWVSTAKVHINDHRVRVGLTDPREAIVRIIATTICGSDLHLYHKAIPGMKSGDIIGHEGIGIVDEVGAKCTKFQKGDRVTISAIIACGECEYCRKQQFSCCDNTNPSKDMNQMYGHRTAGLFGYSHLTGGYSGTQAEYVRVPYADQCLLALPENISDENALLLSDVACTSWHANELGEVHEGDVVCIWGAGPIGLATSYWAKFRGASRVLVVDNVPERLELAKVRTGAEIIDYNDGDVSEQLKKLVPGGVDVAIECVGSRYTKTLSHKIQMAIGLETDSVDVLIECIKSVKKGGCVSIIGDYVGLANQFPIGAMVEKSLTVRGGQLFAQKYWPYLIDLFSSGKADLSWVFTNRMDLEQADDAYVMFDKKKEGCVKVALYTAFGRSLTQDAVAPQGL